MNEMRRWRLDEGEMQAEVVRLLEEVKTRKPDAILILCRVGKDLMIRGAGTPGDMLKLYADTPDEILRMIHGLEGKGKEERLQ